MNETERMDLIESICTDMINELDKYTEKINKLPKEKIVPCMANVVSIIVSIIATKLFKESVHQDIVNENIDIMCGYAKLDCSRLRSYISDIKNNDKH